MKHHPFTKLASILVVCLLTFTSSVFASDAELMDMVKNMQKQMNELQATVMAQKTELEALKAGGGGKIQMASSGVEAAPPMSEAEFNQRLSDSTGGASKWLKDLKFSGDLRLRYEAFRLHGNPNANPTSTTAGYQDGRNRFRIRLRYGFEKTFNPEIKVGFSMATGDKTTNGYNTDPISTNQSMTNDFNFKNIWVEKAYATYTPEWAKVNPFGDFAVTGFEVTAGKFNNPFEKGSTDMIWDRDLKPEGVYEKIDAKLLDTENFDLKAYLVSMQSVLMETGNSSTAVSNKDANLFAYQAGLNPVFYLPGMERPVDVLSAISVYNYQNYANNSNWMIAGVTQANGNPTNTTTELSAKGFNILSFYQEVNLYPYGIPVKPFAEFARNMSNQSGIGAVSTANRDYTMQGGEYAWSLGLTLGKLVKKGDWQGSYQYKYIGANSVPGAFNDSDFGGYNYGGTDKAGSAIKLGYNLTDYLTLNGACFLVRPITQRNLTTNGMQVDQSVRRFQLDMTYKF